MAKKWTKADKNARRGFFAMPVGDLGDVDRSVPFRWPITADYVVENGEIRPREFKGFGKPLDDPDLFSSLARLSKRGKPSKATIVRWVKKYGLFTWSGSENFGDPLSLEEFREESRQAYIAWTLVKALSTSNPGMFRYSIEREREQGIDKFDRSTGPKGRFAGARVYTGEADDPDATHTVWHGQKLTDDEVLSVMLSDLRERILDKLDLELRFVPNFELPLGHSYRPVPVLMPANLLGAAWLQFCIYVADFDREWRLCVACGHPFKVTRRDQVTCPGSYACQKQRQRLQKVG